MWRFPSREGEVFGASVEGGKQLFPSLLVG